MSLPLNYSESERHGKLLYANFANVIKALKKLSLESFILSCFLFLPGGDVTSRFNRVFWLGDFNFRVEERHGVVVKFLEQCEEEDYPDYEELVSKDQMTRLMKKSTGKHNTRHQRL